MSDDMSEGQARLDLEEVVSRLAQLPNALGLAAQMSEGVAERSGLDLRTLHLVRAAALAATGAPSSAWEVNLEVMDEHVSVEDLEGMFAAIAPIIGTSRYLTAVANIVGND